MSYKNENITHENIWDKGRFSLPYFPSPRSSLLVIQKSIQFGIVKDASIPVLLCGAGRCEERGDCLEEARMRTQGTLSSASFIGPADCLLYLTVPVLCPNKYK